VAAPSMAMNEYFLGPGAGRRGANPTDLIISRLVTTTYKDESGVTHRAHRRRTSPPSSVLLASARQRKRSPS